MSKNAKVSKRNVEMVNTNTDQTVEFLNHVLIHNTDIELNGDNYTEEEREAKYLQAIEDGKQILANQRIEYNRNLNLKYDNGRERGRLEAIVAGAGITAAIYAVTHKDEVKALYDTIKFRWNNRKKSKKEEPEIIINYGETNRKDVTPDE